MKKYLVLLLFSLFIIPCLSQKIDSSWLGTYHLYLKGGKIGGINVGWSYDLIIKPDSIIFSESGYQLHRLSLLKINASYPDSLIVDFDKKLDGFSTYNHSFLKLVKNNNNYYLKGIENLEAGAESTDLQKMKKD